MSLRSRICTCLFFFFSTTPWDGIRRTDEKDHLLRLLTASLCPAINLASDNAFGRSSGFKSLLNG